MKCSGENEMWTSTFPWQSCSNGWWGRCDINLKLKNGSADFLTSRLNLAKRSQESPRLIATTKKKITWKLLKWRKESWSWPSLSPVVGRGQQMGWSLRQTPAQTGCSARARRAAAGGPTQGWARLWWCLRTTLSTQQAGWALGEPVHTELRGARQGGTVDAAQQHILVRIFCACESFSLAPQ